MAAPSQHGLGGRVMGCGTSRGKGHAVGLMLWEGVWVSGPSLGAQVQHSQWPHWLCPEQAGSTVGAGAPCHGAAPSSHPVGIHLPSHPVSPSCPAGAPSSPSRFPGTAVHFSDGKQAPALPLHSKKKPNQKPEERNKQTNPFPLLAWHLLVVLPLLIREAAGIISNKPLLMKFRAADPGGAPRHRFSETLIKFTARRCFQLGWRQSGEAA